MTQLGKKRSKILNATNENHERISGECCRRRERMRQLRYQVADLTGLTPWARREERLALLDRLRPAPTDSRAASPGARRSPRSIRAAIRRSRRPPRWRR